MMDTGHDVRGLEGGRVLRMVQTVHEAHDALQTEVGKVVVGQ